MDGMQFESFSRDLLRRFRGNASSVEAPETTAVVVTGDSDDTDLSLGLSLGGFFADEQAGKGKKLVRSSSLASFSSLPPREQQNFPVIAASLLVRTSSLPTDTEDEGRKRKEIQSLRRIEAKRKRLERRNSMKAASKYDEDNKDGCFAVSPVVNGGVLNGCQSHCSLPLWMARARRPPVSSRIGDSSGGLPLISQGSVGSQGSSSIGGMTEFDNSEVKGFTTSTFNGSIESDNLPMRQVCDSNGNNNAAINSMSSSISTNSVRENEALKKNGARVNGTDNLEKNMMEKMLSVSTKGEGPNGRRIEGFLYKYKKGDELRIVCVCHGSFLTPAEFVKHAGGGDVAYPLRHIIVDTPPTVL